MSIIIEGFDKPASCRSCPLNHSDCWCAITKGGIDRDNYSCDLPCPIRPLDAVLDEINAEIMSLTNGDTPERIWNVDLLEILDKHRAASEGEDTCKKCLYTEEADGSHCYECIKGKSKFKAKNEGTKR